MRERLIFVRRHRGHYHEFRRFHRNLRFLRPFMVVFNILILYLLFKWVGIKTIGIIIAVIIIFKEIAQLYFLWNLERRIFRPIEKIKNGLDEVARGNYDVKIDFNVNNEFGLLINSFNQMAQKLQASEKLKQEYEDNRKDLIANISHDLKTPIATIQGYIEAINEGVVTEPEKVKKYLETINSNTVYINKLVDDLFLFSKLDMDKLEFNFETVSFRSFMDDLMEEYKFELEEKQVQFIYVDKIDQNYNIKIDRKRINQAIRNVISNAVKYGPVGELDIQVKAFEENGFICIDIKDNGPGIPADKLPYVFNRFYRIDTERTKDLVSTGLGLAIAKELIEVHDGQITVASIENQGSIFTIKIPIIESQIPTK